jgi:hypothetical protein
MSFSSTSIASLLALHLFNYLLAAAVIMFIEQRPLLLLGTLAQLHLHLQVVVSLRPVDSIASVLLSPHSYIFILLTCSRQKKETNLCRAFSIYNLGRLVTGHQDGPLILSFTYYGTS